MLVAQRFSHGELLTRKQKVNDLNNFFVWMETIDQHSSMSQLNALWLNEE